MKYKAIINDQTLDLLLSQDIDNKEITIDGKIINYDLIKIINNMYSLILNGEVYNIHYKKNTQYELNINQNQCLVEIKDESKQLKDKLGYNSNKKNDIGKIVGPISGLVSNVYVKKGDKIKKGEKLFILEAMKMENEFKAPFSGIVNKIYYSIGHTVEKGAIIMEINSDG
tara:strand:- start:4544 stop:5053 length:510 start_codon:yes stop_codon:yes gene_type:complete